MMLWAALAILVIFGLLMAFASADPSRIARALGRLVSPFRRKPKTSDRPSALHGVWSLLRNLVKGLLRVPLLLGALLLGGFGVLMAAFLFGSVLLGGLGAVAFTAWRFRSLLFMLWRARRRPYLRMDRMSGDAWILRGQFAGRHLSDLSQEEAMALHYEAAHDPVAHMVIGRWISARYGQDAAGASSAGRERHGGQGGWGAPSGSAMSRDEAFALLGLKPGAAPDEIKRAFRAMMQKHHPDRGGDPERAARIILARDILLGV